MRQVALSTILLALLACCVAGQEAWVRQVLTQLSPRVGEMGANILNSKVEPIVQGALSTLSLGKKAFKFTRIKLGKAKPLIKNIRTHKSAKGLDRVTVDFDIIYQGDSDIQVSILGVSSGVRNVQLSGRARVVLTPTISELPLVGGIQFFFLTKPEIDFDFDGAAKIATKLPAIKTKIKEDLAEDMSKDIIFPNRITLPLSWTADPQLIWQPQLTGILGVRLRSVSGLPKKGGIRSWVGQDKPDAYATIGIGGDEKTTVVAKNTVQHTWEEWYEFPLEEVDGHVVEVNMYDRDIASSDEFLGYAAIDIKSFSQVTHLFNLAVVPDPAKQSKLSSQGAKPGNPSGGQLMAQRASQTLSVEQPIQTRLVEATLESVRGRKTKYAQITGKIGVELAWQPLVQTPGRDTARLFPGSTAAVLSVFIYSANNLAKYAGATPVPIPVGHLPSAQATLTVANYTQATGVSKDSQQAEFKQGFVFKLDKDWKSQTLNVRVDDTEKSVSSFGAKSWKLSELVGVDIKREIVSLDAKITSQTLTVSASLRFPGIPTK